MMMEASDLILLIYENTLEFLEERGDLSMLRKALKDESIDDRMKRVDTKSRGLEIVDAVHCVLDKNRTLAFMNAIEESVKPGDVVVEAGAGTGILAIFAAALQAKVYGIEINKETFGLAQDLAEFFIHMQILDKKNLHLVMNDARIWKPDGKIDVIISENVYAGMFHEMQIPIVSHLLDFLEPHGRVVPDSMQSYVILSDVELPKGLTHGNSFSNSEAEGRICSFNELSLPVLYDEIDFHHKNCQDCRADIEIPIKKSGRVNSLIIYSPITVAPNLILQRDDMIFMGEDIFIVIDPPIQVENGSTVRLRIAYERGDKPEEGFYELKTL
jgi:predicted RNA methylase